jgi:hypothetical protein
MHPTPKRGRYRRPYDRAGRAGKTSTMGMFFGPTNVDIWRMSIEVGTITNDSFG